ncbi:ABC transporter permease [Lutibaculum baratangense]|uniref:Polar amino acid uptake family ABC transporter, permease protein n=1 Tax=Lutibaculum baratangense AMV1 TaxID=631454 RepID=V4RK88_9HYPH|nr:ABC transporter permease [Lutibaculum baratangense]ESR25744.1 polar amino acid uptake family ABC transporter, permease protein [Lutibaculum baratangense AMV1]
MDFDWLPRYWPLLVEGFWRTLWLVALSGVFGFLLAIPVALAQVAGGRILAGLSRAFTTTIRGTPLLVQLYLVYYGLGSLMADIPAIRYGPLWPYLRDGFWYATFAFTISVAAYQGEIIRGGLLAVPRGEIEAARAFGMRRSRILRRIWLPRALQVSLPALSGEAILLLKSTPLAATVTVIDLFGAANVVRSETFLTYEPLLFVAAVYVLCAFVIAVAFRLIERRVPSRRGL